MFNKDSLQEMNGHGKLLQELIDIRNTLPNKQQQLCDYMIENYQTVGVYTLSELADLADVGTTTAMRLINNLGYESYLDIKKDISEASVQTTPSAWWHLQESFKTNKQKDHTTIEVFNETKSILEQTVTLSLFANFDRAVELLLSSSNIFLLGVRSNKALANYFGSSLKEFYPKVTQLSNDTDFIYDRLLRFKKDDLLLLIDNSPFTTIGIETAKFCYEKGFTVILLTDHLSSFAADYATVILNTAASNKQYSVTPTLFVLESILMELREKMLSTSKANIQKRDYMLKKKNIIQPK